MKTLVIVPAYNEEESIEHTMDTLLRECPDVDYLIVNDGSMDHTKSICWQQGYSYLDLPVNLGLAGAFQAGVKYAYAHDYDCVIQFDADGQHEASCIPLLIEHAAEYDVVIGSRFVNREKPLSLRMFGSNLISFAIWMTTGHKIADPTSGMRAFGKRMIRAFAYSLNFAPEPDTVSYLIRKTHASVCEVQVQMNERFAGKSYLTIRNSMLYMIRMTISILLIQFFRKNDLIGA